MTRLKLGAEPQQQGVSSSGNAAAEPAADMEKQVRALRKKLAACEALLGRKTAGSTLTGPELDKLGKNCCLAGGATSA